MRPLSTRDDPFFIARGKRQLPKDDDDVQFKQRTSENGEKFVTSRVKREAAAKVDKLFYFILFFNYTFE